MNAHQHKAAQSAFFNWYVTTQLYKKQHDMFALKFKCVVISSRLQINNNAPHMHFKIGKHDVIRLRRHSL